MSEQHTAPTAVDPADVESTAAESTAEVTTAEATDVEASPAEATETASAEEDAPQSDSGADEANELDTEAEVAADFLEELLDIADLDGDIDTYIENGRAQVSIVTDSQILVGRNGEVLEALQEIVRLAVMAETDNRTRLMLDVAGFRDKRRTTLRGLASDAVQEVQESGESVRLAPMNPFERKIVHDTVAEAGLTSESEGTEPQRRVVVLPAK